jgi:hypothetical protein
MKWLLDFFYCRSWREFFALSCACIGNGVHRVLGFARVCVCDVRIVCYMV